MRLNHAILFISISKNIIFRKNTILFLDLLSKNIKTNRNKRVFFAVEFLTEKL